MILYHINTQVNAMTMEEIENMKNFGPQVSGCLAKPPPTLTDPNPSLPCARSDVKIQYHPDKVDQDEDSS